MSKSPSDSPLSKQALQAIGRNVLNLQKVEGMLKALVISSGMESSAVEFAEELDRLKESVSKRSMGVLVGDLFRTVYVGEATRNAPRVLSEASVSFSFQIVDAQDSVQVLKDSLAQVVEERNGLIHQKLLGFDPSSEASCAALISDLDEQNERIRPIYAYLQSHLRALVEAKKVLLKAIEDEFEETSDDA